jgi:hypothetical protein
MTEIPLPLHTGVARFEELQYADGASYMDAGRVVISGSVDQLRAHLRAAGAVV